jgi:hypothetical protein
VSVDHDRLQEAIKISKPYAGSKNDQDRQQRLSDVMENLAFDALKSMFQ